MEENSLNKNRSILFNNQDEDSFIYYDTKEAKKIDYKLPAAFTQVFLGENNALFCAFDGALQNINLNNSSYSNFFNENKDNNHQYTEYR